MSDDQPQQLEIDMRWLSMGNLQAIKKALEDEHKALMEYERLAAAQDAKTWALQRARFVMHSIKQITNFIKLPSHVND